MLTHDQEVRIPWDKSLIIRFAFLDLMHGIPKRSIKWLELHYEELGDDLRALLRTLKQYLAGEDLDVGESATLLRFWSYYLWTCNEGRTIITHDTLNLRDVSNDWRLINWNVDELCDHPEGTSQWASIAILFGKRGTRRKTDPHVQLSYRARNEWEQATERGEMWPARKDETIAECIDAALNGATLRLNNSEKGCAAVALKRITPREMRRRWPKSMNHESNRPKAMRFAMRRARLRKVFWWLKIWSDDHRVVMAMACTGIPRKAFSNPDCVNKTTPLFWELMELAN